MTVFGFEEIGADLARPPLAAARSLFRSGIVLSLRGWSLLSPDHRRTLVNLGAGETIDPIAVQRSIVGEAKHHMKMMSITSEPDPEVPPERLVSALGPQLSLTPIIWKRLSSLERYVLSTLSTNTRLLARASKEILAHVPTGDDGTPWRGLLAACEVNLAPNVLGDLMSSDFLDGKAMLLARASGVRAARRASELFDLYADTTIGPVELDWGVDEAGTKIVWQAHASTWDGAFYPIASLLAVTTAAAALVDMASRHGEAALEAAGLFEDAWRVGRETVDEGATRVFSVLPAKGEAPVRQSRAAELQDALPNDQTVRDVNPGTAELLRKHLPMNTLPLATTRGGIGPGRPLAAQPPGNATVQSAQDAPSSARSNALARGSQAKAVTELPKNTVPLPRISRATPIDIRAAGGFAANASNLHAGHLASLEPQLPAPAFSASPVPPFNARRASRFAIGIFAVVVVVLIGTLGFLISRSN